MIFTLYLIGGVLTYLVLQEHGNEEAVIFPVLFWPLYLLAGIGILILRLFKSKRV